jgi:hypothetical protein
MAITFTGHVCVSPQARKSTEMQFDVNDLKRSCILINTADYCQTTALEVRWNISRMNITNSRSARGENSAED